MPISIPAFAQYQAPLPPLRGLWNSTPAEGDKFVNAEIVWGTLGGSPPYTAVQFQLSGNSPVALSQIAALYCDNSRSGADVSFIFPDSGFSITIPAHAQGLVPVLSNALMFYANAPAAATGDVTVIQVCNSMPPPIALATATTQASVSVANINLATVAATVLVPAGKSGRLTAFSISLDVTAAGAVEVGLQDGAGNYQWLQAYNFSAGEVPADIHIDLSNLSARFVNGLNFVVTSSSGGLTGTAICNVYYQSP